MGPHLDKLMRQLTAVRGSLMASYTKVKSIIGSSSVTNELRELEKEIDDFLSCYSLSATMNMENTLSALDSFFRGTDANANMFLRIARSNLESLVLHSPVELGVEFLDPRGRKTRVSMAFLNTHQQFKRYLDVYYDVGSTSPIRGAAYVESGRYTLTCSGNEVNDRNWTSLLETQEPLEMFLIFKESQFQGNTGDGRCPRCNTLLSRPNKLECWHCDLDCSELESSNQWSLPPSWDFASQVEDATYFSKFMTVDDDSDVDDDDDDEDDDDDDDDGMTQFVRVRGYRPKGRPGDPVTLKKLTRT
ncbi:hypothetical protein SCHPADRAFT_499157 [Schizopora paradoxa]|uniref:Ubiquitin-like domain-containing protein n=1 Tax=Schizopora paradoxa TaxID=27342 RepID=A0A0H2RG82_9AGAM|nr:hypothetical protein SCHPADRAFT_499157 [Schizopora paradoxa]